MTQYHLVLFLPDEAISRELFVEIQEELENKISTSPEETAIDIWIESGGGDAHAAYKMILELRSRCSQLQAIIPDYAKSAATLMVLGVDKIYMDAASELGPLDVQISHPDRESTTVSGLDVANALEFLAQSATHMVVSGGASIIRSTRMARSHVLHENMHFVAELFQPLIAKLDPTTITKVTKQLQVAERYAVAMLKNRNVPNDKKLTNRQARDLMTRLIQNYPVHEFVISRDEARSLGLPVVDAIEHPHWDSIKRFYKRCVEKAERSVFIFNEADVFATSSDPSSLTEEGENMDETLQDNEEGDNNANDGKTHDSQNNGDAEQEQPEAQ